MPFTPEALLKYTHTSYLIALPLTVTLANASSTNAAHGNLYHFGTVKFDTGTRSCEYKSLIESRKDFRYGTNSTFDLFNGHKSYFCKADKYFPLSMAQNSESTA